MTGFHSPQVAKNDKEPRRIYVSGPMSGYEDFNHPAFHDAAARLREVGYEVESPPEIGDSSMAYTELIREDIRIILGCDGVAVLEGWWASRGAHIETSVAGIIGLPIRSVEEWVNRRK